MITNEYENKHVLVTGDTGFLGSHITKLLLESGAIVLGISLTEIGEVENYELVQYSENPKCRYQHNMIDLSVHDIGLIQPTPDYIFHCAGYNGGIQFNIENPYDIFYKNTMMGLRIINTALKNKVKKVVSIVASCAYPDSDDDFRGYDYPRPNLYSEYFLNAEPNPTVIGHAYGKRNLHIASILANRQYETEFITVCPTTLIGPGDCLELNKTKVGMAIIKKIVDAKREQKESITFMGSGNPFRDFVDVADAARCILLAGLKYTNSLYPMNISFANEFKIKHLVKMVAELCDYKGEILWDTSKPDGQFRKKLDNSHLRIILNGTGFTVTDFKDTLQRTIKWYENLQS